MVRQLVTRSPDTILIIVTNPLDAMCEVARRVSGFPRERVIGMAGVLDAARMRWFIAEKLNVSVEDVDAFVLGGHGDTMVPLPRYATVNGIPPAAAPRRPRPSRRSTIARRTAAPRSSTTTRPAPPTTRRAPPPIEMVAAILHDKKKILPCAVLLQGEYGYNDLFIGVPCRLGRGGMEGVVELELSPEEKAQLDKSAAAVKSLVEALPKG